jgi:hypothetical protein
MSRGHGEIERLILVALRWDRRQSQRGTLAMGTDARRLVQYIRVARATGYGRWLGTANDPWGFDNGGHPKPTRSELESVRRALRNLRRQGLLQEKLRLNYSIWEQPGKKPNTD